MDPSAALLFNKRSEALSLILSLLLPGLGQIYNGQATKGAAILIAIFGVIIIPLIAYIVLWFYVAYILLWFYGMYDAYTTAKEYNAYLLEHNGQPPW